MTHRERWVRTLHFEPVDRIPDEEFGYWSNTFPTWHDQGMSRDVTDDESADRYFGFVPRTTAAASKGLVYAPRNSIPTGLGLVPPFEPRVLEEDENYRVESDGAGIVQRVHKSGKDSIPQYLDYPLKGRREWEELFRPRLSVENAERYPENRPDWEDLKARLNSPNWGSLVEIDFSGLFGGVRNWMGFERITTMMYDDPELMHEIIEHLATLSSTVIRRAVEEINVDVAWGWEDMAFRQGPMISPTMFREFLVPRYRMITDVLHAGGVDLICTDCDGRVVDIIDCWLEAGLTGIFPCEVGVERDMTDPIVVREKYGDRVFIVGGVNKHALIAGRAAIREEIARIKP